MRDCFCGFIAIAMMVLVCGCSKSEKPQVIIYTALDREFSEPILRKFEADTGIMVLPVYDTEVDKSVGLVTRLRTERNRPQCDVFWNNEIVNTLRLRKEGLLAPCTPKFAKDYPAVFQDPDGMWYGFAGRARVIIVNTEQVKPGDEPKSIQDFLDPKWKGRLGIAKPIAGTAASHVACLFALWGEEKAKQFLLDLKRNDVRFESGNKQVALNVSSGRLAFGLTDTDDAISEVEKGRPVKILYPDSGTQDIGVLFIPNTLSIVKGGPNAANAAKLIDYLLSPAVEAALAKSKSAQIPLGRNVVDKPRVKTPNQVKAMKVNFVKAAEMFDAAAEFVQKDLLR